LNNFVSDSFFKKIDVFLVMYNSICTSSSQNVVGLLVVYHYSKILHDKRPNRKSRAFK